MKVQDIPRYTYQDYKNWKEDWELINGYPYSLMPAAGFRHNIVQSNAVFQGKYSLIDKLDCNCWIVSEFEWKVNSETIVRPDMMIICNRPQEEFLEFPPALVLEIFPSSRKKDRTLKFDLYEEQGVKYYLMADYDKQQVEVYELIDNVYREVKKSTFVLDNDCEVQFDFSKWWA